MFRKILIYFLICLPFAVYAANPTFNFYPNIYDQQLSAQQLQTSQNKIIHLLQQSINVNANRRCYIHVIYGGKKINEFIVTIINGVNKCMSSIKFILDQNENVIDVIRHYHLQPSDLKQSAVYSKLRIPTCPDASIQFVIGNNFLYDISVKKEVGKTYALAKKKGYNPVLLDINDTKAPQPTVQSYLDWMSCPNVKGFYNESHGSSEGIKLSDEVFVYSIIDQNLNGKLDKEILMLDSCNTFHDPLLMSFINSGRAQQYIAGFISLPFGSSERTASCIWKEAFEFQGLDDALIRGCAIANKLTTEGFKIAGKGDSHIRKPIPFDLPT